MKIRWDNELAPRLIAILQHYQDLMEEGLALPGPNPFYFRNDVLTKEVVDRVVEAIEGAFIYELNTFPGYHQSANRREGEEKWPEGVELIRPGFTELPSGVKLALVQDLDAVMQEYRVEGPAGPVEPATLDGEYHDAILDYYC